MLENYTEFFLLNPFRSGFLHFTLGGLMLLAVYHFFLGLQNKSSLYGWYAFYLFLIVLSQNQYFRNWILYPFIRTFGDHPHYGEFLTEAYHIVYFFFAFKFLNIKEDFPKWYRYIKRGVLFITGYSLVQLLIYIYTGDFWQNMQLYHFFVIYMLILSIFMYILMFRSKRPLKYYLIIGSLLLLVFSVGALAWYIKLEMNGEQVDKSFSLLYIGFVTENFLFSLGLGKRQKLILDERNSAQKELIVQMQQNEKLEQEFRSKLELEIEELKSTLEKDAMERLSVQYEKDIAELKLASLRSQMNPHFIFNSLNSIKGFIIDNDQEQAVYYLNKFSKLIRMILSSSMEKDITLSEEIEIAKLYLQVENIRFNNEIQFEVTVDEALALNSIKVPALILQPFLENAIWHGLSNKEGERMLNLTIEKEGDYLKISVSDNGIGREAAAKIKEQKFMQQESYGMKLTEERLRTFGSSYKGDFSIKIEDLTDETGKATGTTVRVMIPIVLN